MLLCNAQPAEKVQPETYAQIIIIIIIVIIIITIIIIIIKLVTSITGE